MVCVKCGYEIKPVDENRETLCVDCLLGPEPKRETTMEEDVETIKQLLDKWRHYGQK